MKVDYHMAKRATLPPLSKKRAQGPLTRAPPLPFTSPYHQLRPISAMAGSKPPVQLPLLHNPLLHCILNNPNSAKHPFRNTIDLLRQHHYDYALVLPPAPLLHQWYDPASDDLLRRVLLRELCYSLEDFIQSHIIKVLLGSSLTPRAALSIYTTMNGKQLLIKNGVLFPGKGFKRLVRVNLVDVGYVPTFADYFPRGARLLVLYVDLLLWGALPPIKPSPQPLPPPNPASHPTTAVELVTFDRLLRNFPLLSKVTSDHFYRLFHHNNPKYRVLLTYTQKPVEDIVGEFNHIRDDAYDIVLECVRLGALPLSDQTKEMLQKVMETYPTIDLNQLVHEYVELNLYDKVWAQLLLQFESLAPPLDQFHHVLLNQLDMPVHTPWAMDEMHHRVAQASATLAKLDDDATNNARLKLEVVTATVRHLSRESPGLVVDADTLIGLLIMVVCQAQVTHLDAHLFYIRKFSVNATDGTADYILANFDAVLFYLKEHGDDVARYSRTNREWWQAIRRAPETASKMLSEAPSTAPPSHWLYARTALGESAAMLAIKAHQPQLFMALLYYNPEWFGVEDLLFDRTVDTHQSLLMVSLEEKLSEVNRELVAFLKLNCSRKEIELYLNTVDSLGRSVGHYLFHDIDLIDSVGEYINWNLKDNNAHTPLLSLCRCYDHANYRELIAKVFAAITRKYGPGNLDFDYHVDKVNNTLLHVIKSDLDASHLLSEPRNLVNVNQTNARLMTPLMLYAKYLRNDNLDAVLNDDRLDFLYENSKLHFNVFDYTLFKEGDQPGSESALKLVAHYRNMVGPRLAALSCRWDGTLKDWAVLICDLGTGKVYPVHLKTIGQLIYTGKRQYPWLLALVDEDKFWLNYNLRVSGMLIINKFQVNRVIDQLNVVFEALHDLGKSGQPVVDLFRQVLDQQLTLETMEKIYQEHSQRLAAMGQVELSRQHIQDMEVFFMYSLENVVAYHTLIMRFNKLLAVALIKVPEIAFSLEQMVNLYAGGREFTFLEAGPPHSTWNTLLNYTSWLELSVADLVGNIKRVLAKTALWKDTYRDIRELNLEITKCEELLPLSPTQTNESTTTNGSTATDPGNGGETLVRRNTFTIDPLPDNISEEDTTLSFFNFANIVENKKLRYRRLLYTKASQVKKIMDLNQELKLDHELMAAEISQFISFRGDFIRHAFARHTQAARVRLRQRLTELQIMKRSLAKQ